MAVRDVEPARQPASAPRRESSLLVGSVDGTVALVRATTGAVIWRYASHREVGTLAHDGVRAYIPLGSRLRLLRSGRRETPDERQRRHERIQAEPAQLEAHDTNSGRLLWRRGDWGLIGRLDVGAGGDVVVVASTSVYGEHALYGLDARTGATLWTLPATGRAQDTWQDIVVRGDRVYVSGQGDNGGRLALSARTGERLWRLPLGSDLVYSPRGAFIVEQQWRSDGATTARVLDVATGHPGQERAIHGAVRAVTDAGIAYCGRFEEPGIAAVDLSDGRERWRADDVLAYQLAVTEPAVYCAHLVEPEYVGVVEALDARTGQRLSRWQTPATLRQLLELWGARTPWMLAASGMRIGLAVGAALAQPSPRAIRNALAREIRSGQWRHPYALHGAVNAMWLAASQDAAYLGTRLGVFALRAGDGHLLWHALPATDLSFVAPALAPPPFPSASSVSSL